MNLGSTCLGLPRAEITGSCLAQIMPLIRKAGDYVPGCVWKTPDSLRDHDVVLKGGQVFPGGQGWLLSCAAHRQPGTAWEGWGIVELGVPTPE